MLLAALAARARVDPAGALVLLEDQDRARWDHAMIDEGVATLDSAMAIGVPGPYQVQAAIAALHAQAPRAEDTDWPQIATLYRALAERAPSPVVSLNHAVAVAMADGPDGGSALTDELADELDGVPPVPCRARRSVPPAGSRRRCRRLVPASPRADDEPEERAFLERRLRGS